jgi:hypothetical protein
MTIQYCMPLPADLLESTEIPAVTQTRVSGDYHPGNGQWRIGPTSLLAWSLGLAPFKDTFWTTADEPGSHYGPSTREPNFELETLVAALSAGPIGPGDKIGLTDVPLLMKTCRTDGLLLKPDKPATPLDRWFLTDEPGQICDTSTAIGADRWHFILAADLHAAWTLTPGDLHVSGECVAYNPETDAVSPFDKTHPLSLSETSRGARAVPFGYWIIAPETPIGWAFLGETDKFVTVSRQRFARISPNGLDVTADGVPNERITLQWRTPAPPALVKAGGQKIMARYDPVRNRLTVSVTIPASGTVSVDVETRG